MFNFAHSQSPLRDAITANYRLDETVAVNNLAATIQLDEETKQRIEAQAKTLITKVRADRSKSSWCGCAHA